MIMLLGLGAAWASLDACFQESESARDAYRCAYREARTTGDYTGVIVRVRAELSAHPEHAWGYHTLGSLLTDQGKNKEGIEFFTTARDRFDSNHDVLGQVYSRLNLGKEYQHAEDVDEARGSYLAAAKIAEENERDDLMYAAKLSLARGLMSNTENLGEAWAIATSVHDEIFPDGNYQTQLLALHVLTRLATLSDRQEERLSYLNRKLELAIAEEDAYVIASSRADVAEAILSATSRGMHSTDVDDVEALLKDVDPIANPYVGAQAFCQRAEAHRLAKDYNQSIDLSEKCVSAWEALDELGDLRGAVVQAAMSLAATQPELAEQRFAAALAMASEDVDRDALTVEHLELLGLMKDWEGLRRGVEPALAALKRMRGRQKNASARSGLSRSRGQFVALAASWFAGMGEAPEALDLELAMRLSEVARGGSVEASPRLADLQASVPDDTAIVAYLLPRTHLDAWAFVITADSVRVVELPEAKAISRGIETFYGMIAERTDGVFEAADPLYRGLIAPLELPKNLRHVIMVPNGALHHVPFGMLAEKGEQPFMQHHSVSIVPSLSWWLNQKKPLQQEVNPLLVGVANAAGLPSLPSAYDEVALVHGILGGEPPLLDDEATRAAVLSGHPNWLHVAAHVLVDDRYPDQTSIQLGGGESLSVADVRDRDWSGTVVVLSSCRSVSGRALGGELPLGLGRAFMESRATAVIGSLWPVRDAEARAFFSVFYDAIARGATLEESLQQAELQRAADGVPPEGWAGMVLLGDGRGSVPTLGR